MASFRSSRFALPLLLYLVVCDVTGIVV
jgi:hypothetical protein